MKGKFWIVADFLIAAGLIGSAMKGLISWDAAISGVVLSLKPSGIGGIGGGAAEKTPETKQ